MRIYGPRSITKDIFQPIKNEPVSFYYPIKFKNMYDGMLALKLKHNAIFAIAEVALRFNFLF